MRLALASLGLGLGTTLGCLNAPTFACSSDAQCGGDGQCQDGGFCSFPDSECESGQRYDKSAGGGLGGECVPVSDESTSTTGTSSSSSGSTTTTTSTTTVDPTGTGADCLPADWWDCEWSSRRQLVFQNGTGAPVADSPVLVVLDTRRIEYDVADALGADLRFVDDDGTTVLAHEIESWVLADRSFVWVHVPRIEASDTDHIWMYYGNGVAADGQNAGGVWPEPFHGVWHLGAGLSDSTILDQSLVDNGSQEAPGQVASARTFPMSDAYLDAGAGPALADLFAAGGTISAWIRPVGFGEGGVARIVDKAEGGTGTNGHAFFIRSQEESLILARDFDGGSGFWHAGAGAIVLDAWQWVVVVYDDSSELNIPAFYIDGVPRNPATLVAPLGNPISEIDRALLIGNASVMPTRGFQGEIDEVRVSAFARSEDWVTLQYRSMTDTLISFGAAEMVERP